MPPASSHPWRNDTPRKSAQMLWNSGRSCSPMLSPDLFAFTLQNINQGWRIHKNNCIMCKECTPPGSGLNSLFYRSTKVAMTSLHSTYPLLRGLAPGLHVLSALNLCVEGRASSGELAKMTGLHRTTVRRLLETLSSQGYVWRSDSDDSFQLALKVRELSE